MTVQKIIPSYVYQEYVDDEDVVAFVRSYNDLAQGYLNWSNTVGLPIYTNVNVNGDLLDWVALGLYGFHRPSFSQTTGDVIYGIIGSFAIGISPIDHTVNYISNDDVFKRCLTWNLYQGDGRYFTIDWLKRRVRRFLDGINGVDPGVSETYNVQVTFSSGNLVNIILLTGTPMSKPTSVPNTRVPNAWTPNSPHTIGSSPFGLILKAAIESGVLQLPFQYRYAVFG